MNFDDLKERLRDSFNTTWSRIQESSTYNNLREKYEALPLNQQKALSIGALVLGILILLWFPYSYISTSSDYMSDFQEKRTVLRELLRVSRQSQTQAPIPQAPSLEAIQQSADNIFTSANLMAEQKGHVQSVSSKEGLGFIPPTVAQQSYVVDAKKLNLKQVVDIGFELSRSFAAVKLMSVDVKVAAGAPAPGYFDVMYKLVSYSFPHMETAEEEAPAGRGRGGSGGGNKRFNPPAKGRTPPPTVPAEEVPTPEEGE